MKSVADELARETLERTLALSGEERLALALRLGRDAATTLANARGVTVEEATRILRRNNQVGRRPSRSAAFDDE